jgi:hypothetical protein
MNGHVNRENQPLCAERGVPVLAHLSKKPATADRRWHVDPTSRHPYRYWDGRTWRRHVVGNGAFSTESRIKTTPRSTEGVRISGCLHSGKLRAEQTGSLGRPVLPDYARDRAKTRGAAHFRGSAAPLGSGTNPVLADALATTRPRLRTPAQPWSNGHDRPHGTTPGAPTRTTALATGPSPVNPLPNTFLDVVCGGCSQAHSINWPKGRARRACITRPSLRTFKAAGAAGYGAVRGF